MLILIYVKTSSLKDSGQFFHVQKTQNSFLGRSARSPPLHVHPLRATQRPSESTQDHNSKKQNKTNNAFYGPLPFGRCTTYHYGSPSKVDRAMPSGTDFDNADASASTCPTTAKQRTTHKSDNSFTIAFFIRPLVLNFIRKTYSPS